MYRLLYDHKWMDLKEDHNGEAFVQMNEDAVMIVPITHTNKILFIEEKSIAYQTNVLTLPTGGVDLTESSRQAANRELQEEVGYKAQILRHIGTLNPAIKYMHWEFDVYLAQNLVPSLKKGDEISPITIRPIHLSSISKLIKTRKLTDATTIAALLLAQRYLFD